MRRPLPSIGHRRVAVLAAVLLVLGPGCFGTAPQYELTATDVTGEVGTHATADLDRYERRVADRLTRKVARGLANDSGPVGTITIVGWQPLDDGDYVERNGDYYRIDGQQVGERAVEVPHLALVPANGSADIRREDLDQPDREFVALAHRLVQERAEEGGTVRDPRFAAPYFYGANDSRLLDANGSRVRAFDTTYRVVVFDAAREADIYRYGADQVATSEAAFARHVSRNVTLDDAERDVLERALNGSYTVDGQQVEDGEAPGFVGLAGAAGVDRKPYRTDDPVYIRVEGRYYELRVAYYGH